MSADFSATLLQIAIVVVPIVLAITLHEASHGFVAWKLGDDTAYRLGRVTFNPLRHIDPLGTIILPMILYFSTGYMFGYAKPVPVNFRRLRNPKRDMVLVAAAGPATNLLLAIASAILLRVAPEPDSTATAVVTVILLRSIFLNIILALFNMIPLPPLDGGRVAVGLLPYPLSMYLARVERYGMLILILALIILPLLGEKAGVNIDLFSWVLLPAAQHIHDFILWITGNPSSGMQV